MNPPIGFQKFHRSSIGLDIRPQSAIAAFRALLLSANYSAEWSGREWQPAAEVVAVWRTFFQFKAHQTAIIVCSGLLHSTQQVQILKKSAQGGHFDM